jgi:hypothetical protein
VPNAEDQKRARERSERVRSELTAKLRTGGPQSAADPHSQMPGDIALSQVAFQLYRLANEGETVGEGGVFRLA